MTDQQMTAAREIAGQCWCDPETKDKVMDVQLAEAFAKRLAPLMVHHVTVARAIERIREEIHAERGPGTYQDAWLANIAMPILDAAPLDLRTHAGANKMAEILLRHFFPPVNGVESATESHFDFEIRQDKQMRADLDVIVQHLKRLNGSRPRSTTITKLQEAIMWLGMDLKEINEKRPKSERTPGPYPTSYDPSSTRVEPTAEGLKL
jgi:hypothetical protein